MGALLVVLVPVGAAALAATDVDWYPVGDWSRIEREVRAVGTGDTPLLGSESRLGWHHPLPWFLWLLAVPFRISGADSGILVGAALANGVALVAAVVVVARLAGIVRAWWFAACVALMVATLGLGQLADPWNATLPLAPWVLVVVLTWATVQGHVAAFPWLVGVGAVVVGSHLGYAPAVAAVTAVALVGVLRVGRQPDGRRALVAGAVVLVVMWLPALADQAAGSGNLMRIARSQTGDLPPAAATISTERIGVGKAVDIFSDQFGLPAPWMARDPERYADPSFHRAALASPGALLVPTALFAVSLGLAWRRRRAPVLAMHAVAAVAVLASFLTIATIRGVPLDWLARPAWGAAIAVWTAIGWSAIDALAPVARGRARQVVAAGALGGALVLASQTASRPLLIAYEGESAVVKALAAPTARLLDRDDVIYVRNASRCRHPSGLALALDRAGFEVVYPFDEEDLDASVTVVLQIVNRVEYLPDPGRPGPAPVVATTYRPSAEVRSKLPPGCANGVFSVFVHDLRP